MSVERFAMVACEVAARGHSPSGLVGIIGEEFACERFGMELTPPGNPAIDGWIDGRAVQVKARAGRGQYFAPVSDSVLDAVKLVLWVQLDSATFEPVRFLMLESSAVRDWLTARQSATYCNPATGAPGWYLQDRTMYREGTPLTR